MEVEKRGVKGGFFQLFDWNAKSRKRLFSNKSVSHENLNQGNEHFHGSALARVLQDLDNGFAPNEKGHNHYQYASSVSGDNEYGTKAPGVVARLMGLDSLPTSNVTEPCYNIPFIESPSFRDSSYARYAPVLQNEHDIVIFESVRNKLDGLTRNPLDVRLQKVNNRPIEKFQTEILPPKSAKPISVTQHRLLSPVKSPRFVPSRNAAYIIEAAAKIIEQSPRANINGKLPSLGSSFVPLRIRDLKENTDFAEKSYLAAGTSQKCKEHKPVKNMKKQLNTSNHTRSADSYRFKGIEESKRVGSQRLKSKDKSVAPTVQAKTGIQKRDGLNLVDNRSSVQQKEHRNLPVTAQKTAEKRSSSRKSSEVLRLNHQKQNCASNKDRDNYESSSSYPRDRKASSSLSAGYVPARANRTVDKIVVNNNNVLTSRKTNVMAADPGKELPSSRAKASSKKKIYINSNIQSDGSVAQKPLVMKDEKSAWDTIDKKDNLDVVSFTFTSPIKKLGAGSSSSGTVSNMSRSLFSSSDPFARESDSTNSTGTTSEFNVIGGDSLSVLLETKLKELTSKVELSQQDLSQEGSFLSFANSYGNSGFRGKQGVRSDSYCPSIDSCGIKNEKDNKELDHMEEDGNNSNSDYMGYDRLQGSSSVSNQPSLSEASCASFDVDRNLSNEGSLQCLSLESNERISWISTKKSPTAEIDVEISDTASSFSVGTMSEPFNSRNSKRSSCWELRYIGDIINNAELMFEEFALGLSYNVITPEFFHEFENQETEHKLMFDCVGECLQVRCDRLLAGSKAFAKQTALFYERQWLAEEVYREISSWTNLEEMMVDEIVDKDMSCKNGQWVDFGVEAFEEGVEVEERILASLVDEVIDDFLF